MVWKRYLKDGIGCPWASQSKAAPEFECVRTTSDLLRGGRRGGTLATGSTKHKMVFLDENQRFFVCFWMLGSLRWWKFLLWPIRQWQARSIYELAARDTLILYITISSRKWRNYSGIIRLCRGVFHDMFFNGFVNYLDTGLGKPWAWQWRATWAFPPHWTLNNSASVVSLGRTLPTGSDIIIILVFFNTPYITWWLG